MCTSYQNNSIRGPLNAWIFRRLSGYMDYLFGKTKVNMFKNHPETIVEIGPGTGSNMRYMRKGTNLIAIEPNIHMHKDLFENANRYGINLEIKTLIGEEIDLPSNSCDFVVCTLVLCTVEDPIQCIVQIKRILKPSGVFVFIEHVKSKNLFLCLFQKFLHKPWHWFFEGCNITRDTQLLLESSGFSSLYLEPYNLYSPFVPIIPQIKGMAVK